MNKYLIENGEMLYATNADNMMEAEDKFIDNFPDYEGRIFISEIESIDDERDEIIEF